MNGGEDFFCPRCGDPVGLLADVCIRCMAEERERALGMNPPIKAPDYDAILTIGQSKRPCAKTGCFGTMSATLEYKRSGTGAILRQDLRWYCPDCKHRMIFGRGSAESITPDPTVRGPAKPIECVPAEFFGGE